MTKRTAVEESLADCFPAELRNQSSEVARVCKPKNVELDGSAFPRAFQALAAYRDPKGSL